MENATCVWMSMEDKRGSDLLDLGSQRVVSCLLWVLGMKIESSAIVVSTPNPIFLDSFLTLLAVGPACYGLDVKCPLKAYFCNLFILCVFYIMCLDLIHFPNPVSSAFHPCTPSK